MQNKGSFKKRVLLVKPPSSTIYGFPKTPPLGVGLLATILRNAEFEIKALDMRLKGYDTKRFHWELESFNPHMVGFSTSSFEYLNTEELCKIAKDFNKDIVTIVGGPHASSCPERTLNSEAIDYIAVGEGDYLLKEFVEDFPDKEKMCHIPGIGYRNDGEIHLNNSKKPITDLDNLPFMDMALFPLDAYRVKGQLTIPLFTSRGCPYQCSFCTSFRVHGHRYRTRSPKSLVDEIEYNVRRFNTSCFTILDDTFNIDRQRVVDICNEILKRKLDIQWECVQGIRADRITEDILRLMKEAGCRQVAIGIESADEEVLEMMNKGERLGDVRKAIQAANRVGLITKGFFIVGAPYDNEEKVRKAVRFFKENNVYIPRFSMIVVYPETPLESWVRKNATFFYEPYEYVTEHNELADAAVQFQTEDFSKKERLAMFRYADAQAEIWFIRNKLVDKFGLFWGRLLTLPFRLRISRQILKAAYKLNLVNVYS